MISQQEYDCGPGLERSGWRLRASPFASIRAATPFSSRMGLRGWVAFQLSFVTGLRILFHSFQRWQWCISLCSFQDLALVCPLAGEIFNLGNIETRPNSEFSWNMSFSAASHSQDGADARSGFHPEGCAAAIAGGGPARRAEGDKGGPQGRAQRRMAVLRGLESFSRNDFFKESLQFMLPYHIVAVLSLCENWLMRDQTTGPPGAQSCCTHCTAAAAWEGGPTAAWPRPWQTMSPGWRPKPLRYEGWNFVIQDWCICIDRYMHVYIYIFICVCEPSAQM